MPDPRRNCPTLINKENRLQSRKKGLFDAIGNLGKLEALNEIGGGYERDHILSLGKTTTSYRTLPNDDARRIVRESL